VREKKEARKKIKEKNFPTKKKIRHKIGQS